MMLIKVLLFCLTILPRAHAANLADLATTFSQISDFLDTIGVSNCSLISTEFPGGSLPPPSPGLSLKYVTGGRGTQNYTCDRDSNTTAPRAVGAAATLLDLSCVAWYNPVLFHILTPVLRGIHAATLPFFATIASQITAPETRLIVGRHQFNAAGQPVFDLRLGGGTDWMVATKNASVPAPVDNTIHVPWLKLTEVRGAGVTVSLTCCDPYLSSANRC
ncbi:hypothetical protein BDV28DRAFT_141685 [Aspergillus coremiiformis]|uniref:Malate dehydrogenase n=1 Tax=Aspergillus coremiiformis TaxID=138285 RepID=A0A5N6YXQ4_9EURO|nr:hypothetical protein BDV28DRAFT_141685 [Aspergillus coremiiformis]